MLNDSVEFKIKQNTYKIEDVRVGHFIDFERMKASLSGGMYGQMLRMGTVAAEEALTMVDIEAFFTVFCPKLIKDLESERFKDLGLKDFKEIRKVYIDKIVPWYNSYIELLKPEKVDESDVKA